MIYCVSSALGETPSPQLPPERVSRESVRSNCLKYFVLISALEQIA